MAVSLRRRPTRVLSAIRVGVATVWLAAAELATIPQPSAQPVLITVLLLYLLWCFAVAALSWRNWWIDYRSRSATLVVDGLVITTVAMLTGGFASPIISSTLFVVVSAAILLGWRAAAYATAAFAALLVIAAVGTSLAGGEIESGRAVMRLSGALAAAAMIVWVSRDRQSQSAMFGYIIVADRDRERAALRDLLAEIAVTLEAQCVSLSWRQGTDSLVAQLTPRGWDVHSQPFVAGMAVSPSPSLVATVFDKPASRWATGTSPASMHSDERYGRAAIDAAPADMDVGYAVAFPLNSGCAMLFVGGLGRPFVDDIPLAISAAGATAQHLNLSALRETEDIAATERVNLALACNVHDTVMQSLAGVSFRLEALKAWIARGADPVPEIDRLKKSLAEEQLRVREYVGELRSTSHGNRSVDLRTIYTGLIDDLSAQWGIAAVVDADKEEIPVPQWLAFECTQILREAFSNAARHGLAKSVNVRLAHGDALMIDVESDRPALMDAFVDPGGGRPWSIYERVKRLGGTMTLVSGAGSRLSISLPMDSPA